MTGTHQIAALSLWRRLWSSSWVNPDQRPMLYLLAFSAAIQVMNVFIRSVVGRSGVLLILTATCVLAFLTFAVIALRKNPSPIVDFDRALLLIGAQATSFAKVDEAAVVHARTKRRDELLLWFGGHGRRHAMVVLRADSDALSESDRAVLAAMVERSSIQLPAPKADPYDPKGKFAWLDQQGFATKEQVLDALLHTPATGDIRRH